MKDTDKVNHNIIFFDGECNLCNGAIDYIVRHSPHDAFKIASLQGQTAKSLLKADFYPDSILFYDKGGNLFYSDAIIAILKKMSKRHQLLGSILKILPKSLRDFGYRLLAKYRFQFFGRRKTCRLPSKEEEDIFLP